MATTVVGKLIAVLSAQTRPFETAMQKAQRTLGGFAISTRRAFGILTGANLLTSAIRRVLATDSAMEGLRKQFDATAHSVIVAFMPAMQAAANIIGQFALMVQENARIVSVSIAFVAGFTAAWRATTAAIAAAVIAMKAFQAAQKAAAIGSALLLALGGPKGIVQLGLGLAAGTAAALAINAAFSNMATSATSAAGAVQLVSNQINVQSKAIERWEDHLTGLARNYFQLIETPEQAFLKAQFEINTLLEAGRITLEQYERILAKLTEDYLEQTDAMKAWRKLQGEAERVIEETRTPLERYEETVRRLNELLEESLIDQETFNRAIQQAEEDLRRATEQAEKLNEKLVETQEIEKRDAGRFQEARLSRLALAAAPAPAISKPLEMNAPKVEILLQALVKLWESEPTVSVRFS